MSFKKQGKVLMLKTLFLLQHTNGTLAAGGAH
jgi:hypothetical protein